MLIFAETVGIQNEITGGRTLQLCIKLNTRPHALLKHVVQSMKELIFKTSVIPALDLDKIRFPSESLKYVGSPCHDARKTRYECQNGTI